MIKNDYRISQDSKYPEEFCIDKRRAGTNECWEFICFAQSEEAAEERILEMQDFDKHGRIKTIKEFPYVES